MIQRDFYAVILIASLALTFGCEGVFSGAGGDTFGGGSGSSGKRSGGGDSASADTSRNNAPGDLTGQRGDLPGGGNLNSEDGFLQVCRDTARLKSMSAPLNYGSTIGGSCALWSPNPSSGAFNAATRQDIPIVLPAGAVLCSMKISGSATNFTYDDVFHMMFDDIAVLSSAFSMNDFNTYGLQKVATLYLFELQKFWGRNRYGTGAYCGPGATCAYPATQTTGAFSIDVSETFFAKIYDRLTKKTTFNFSVLVSGNGEQGSGNFDCQHSMLNLTADIKYFKP